MKRSERWAIVGENGSGKTLLAECLMGKLPLAQGTIEYGFGNGPDVEEHIGHVSFEDRRHTGADAILQSRWNSLEDETGLTVREFLSNERTFDINPFEIGGDHAVQKASFARRQKRAVQLLALGRLLDQTVPQLSNGETQRLLLARALSRDLKWLILDEPFIGLDAAARRKWESYVSWLRKKGLPVLIITARPELVPSNTTHLLRVKSLDSAVVESSPRGPKLLKAQVRESGVARKMQFRKKRSKERPTLIELRNCEVKYDQRTILRNLNWIVREGEAWAVVGPNGSGKSTLLSLILADNPQVYNNDVRLFGKMPGTEINAWQIKDRIGSLSPESQLYFDKSLTCYEAVASGFQNTMGLFEPLTASQRLRARETIKEYDLEEIASMRLSELSAGMERWVLLARAMVKRPRLLLLDEPCQGLDTPHRRQIINLVKKLIRAGKTTIIYITHDSSELPSGIRRVLKLNRNR
jgi:molybdate transport system ATP-binding protein